MTADQTVATKSAAEVEQEIVRYLEERIKTTVALDQDLFKSGLVSSMFAMQLVVFLEETFDIAIIGPDLKLDSFRTVEAMTALVLRLAAPSAQSV